MRSYVGSAFRRTRTSYVVSGFSRTVLAAAIALISFAPAASAQSFLNGDWNGIFHEDQPERGPGPDLADCLGLPINAAARQYANSWDASRLTQPEQQCRAHVSPYIYRGPIRVRITEERDPATQNTIAIKHFLSTYAQERTIWLDGRPHPSATAPHTWMGFSTGRWEGRVLRVETTHIKQGWIRRNGVPMSAEAKLTEYYARHGNILTVMTIVEDPIYLEEPFVRTTDLQLDPNTQPNAYQGWLVCQGDEEVLHEPGWVPHYLPGENPFLEEFAAKVGLPVEPTRGGAQTMYPEYAQKVKGMPIAKKRPSSSSR